MSDNDFKHAEHFPNAVLLCCKLGQIWTQTKTIAYIKYKAEMEEGITHGCFNIIYY